jgi:thioredoxin 1
LYLLGFGGLIDFFSNYYRWCGPCKMIAPIFKDLSEEHGSRAQFIKVDVDDNPEAAQKYGVSAMPTFVFIKGGEVVDRLMGANSDRLKEV